MADSTLALVEIENSEEIFAAFGAASHELFLKEFEHRLSLLVRSGDEVTKVKPNKVCILLHNVSEPVQIELAGAKLERLFEAPIPILDQDLKACVRSAFVPPTRTPADAGRRLQIAESALLDARRSNRTFVIADSATTPEVVPAQRLREIEAGFEQGEFVMHFQPLVHASFRNVVSAEALMRWHRPGIGVWPPSQFTPFLERSSLLEPLTWFALKSSIAELSRLPREIGISVNIPPTLLHDANLAIHIDDALEIFAVAPERLTLEITENAMIERPDETLAALGHLRGMGVRVAIDDFGTGFSSLAAFRDLPVDVLKIDRSFVTNMLDHPRDQDIVRSIIDLAHTFDMKVVAEGVEDDMTADALQALGADVLQGFWFGHAEPAEIFAKRLF